MKTVLVLLFSSLTAFSGDDCIPAREEIDLYEHLYRAGNYHRFHPSGDLMLVTGGRCYQNENSYSSVSLVQIIAKDDGSFDIQCYQTPMGDEAYPVEGSWRLFASPNHSNGMRYYSLKEVLEKEKQANFVANDPDHNQFYHSAAEFSDSHGSQLKFRTLLYSERFRDYDLTLNPSGEVTNVYTSPQGRLCENLGTRLASPILSKNGMEVASRHNGSTEIYKINEDYTCERVDDLGYGTGKVNFSYPVDGSRGKIVFQTNAYPSSNGGIVSGGTVIAIYDRDTKETKVLSNPREDPGYAGMTLDGRVIYLDRSRYKLVRIDPNQIGNGGEVLGPSKVKNCIKKSQLSTGHASNEIMPLSKSYLGAEE